MQGVKKRNLEKEWGRLGQGEVHPQKKSATNKTALSLV